MWEEFCFCHVVCLEQLQTNLSMKTLQFNRMGHHHRNKLRFSFPVLWSRRQALTTWWWQPASWWPRWGSQRSLWEAVPAPSCSQWWGQNTWRTSPGPGRWSRSPSPGQGSTPPWWSHESRWSGWKWSHSPWPWYAPLSSHTWSWTVGEEKAVRMSKDCTFVQQCIQDKQESIETNVLNKQTQFFYWPQYFRNGMFVKSGPGNLWKG